MRDQARPSFPFGSKPGAVVTGGASGIGRAIAERFASSGACVRILDKNAAEAKEAARGIS